MDRIRNEKKYGPTAFLAYLNVQILTIEIAINLPSSELLETHKGTVFWRGEIGHLAFLTLLNP